MSSGYLPVFLNQKLDKIISANGIYINTTKAKLLDTTSGNNNFCILGWNNKTVNNAIINQLKNLVI